MFYPQQKVDDTYRVIHIRYIINDRLETARNKTIEKCVDIRARVYVLRQWYKEWKSN